MPSSAELAPVTSRTRFRCPLSPKTKIFPTPAPVGLNPVAVPAHGDAFRIRRARRQRGEALHLAAIPGSGVKRNQESTNKREQR